MLVRTHFLSNYNYWRAYKVHNFFLFKVKSSNYGIGKTEDLAIENLKSILGHERRI